MKAGKGGGKGGDKGGGKRGKGLNSLDGGKEEEKEEEPENGEGEDWGQEETPSWMLAQLGKVVKPRCMECRPGIPACKGMFGALGKEEETGEEEEASRQTTTWAQVVTGDTKKMKDLERKRRNKDQKKCLAPLRRTDAEGEGEKKVELRKEVYALKPTYRGYKPIEVVVDSAAVDCVMPRRTVDEVRGDTKGPLRQGASALAGVHYVSADGGEIPNEGEMDVNMVTEEKHEAGMTWQVADIKRPLLSVPAMTKTGHEVRFRERDGEIMNKKTRKMIRFVKKGDLYVVTIWMKERSAEEPGFHRPGKK